MPVPIILESPSKYSFERESSRSAQGQHPPAQIVVWRALLGRAGGCEILHSHRQHPPHPWKQDLPMPNSSKITHAIFGLSWIILTLAGGSGWNCRASETLVAADQCAVASVHPLATQAGLDAFAQGGNALDAAIATALTLGVVDNHNSGLGGAALSWCGCRVARSWRLTDAKRPPPRPRETCISATAWLSRNSAPRARWQLRCRGRWRLTRWP